MVQQPSTRPPDHSQVVVFPPVIPLSGFVLGVLLGLVRPVTPLGPASQTVARLAGTVVLAVGAAGFAWMIVTMKKAGTPIHNSETPTALVETGPFRLTRNPMYLFGATAYAGLALLLAQWWSLALLPVVLVVTHYGVVLREEAFLARRFGSTYDRYRLRVRRWL
jgi:protein-S-isoprenylcysteine O-methyltransferase Ste14